MYKISLSLSLFLILFFVGSLVAMGATYTAPSCSYSDVMSAYNSASDGDTVIIPSGSCTWASQLVISKAITLKGRGTSSTIITHGYSDSLIKISPGSDKAIRITDIYFKSSTNNPGYTTIYIDGDTTGTYALTKVRIDHCKIEKGTRAIYAHGWVEGLIDNCTFINCNIAIGITGDNNHSWARDIQAGTSHALFIEDNIFLVNNDTDRQPNEQIYHQEGGRSVVRYNLYDATDYTDYTSCVALFYDSHGNQDYYDGTDDFRGQPIVEVYGNTIKIYKAIGCDIMHFRGGSALVWNNTFTYETGSIPSAIRATEEECWQTAFFSPLDNSWPAEDQINNSFFWGNTLNGSPITDIILNHPSSDCTGEGAPDACCTESGTGTCDDEFIQKDRDYFMHEPQSIGGYEYYTNRKGAAGNGNDGTLVFSASGANAYYPYTPYEYPHPLRGIRTLKGISISGGISTQ